MRVAAVSICSRTAAVKVSARWETEKLWLDERSVVAVQPNPRSCPSNTPQKTAAKGVCKERERRDLNPGVGPRIEIRV
jgi:hypothetical protein